MIEKPVIAIVGPTASGKSELGIALALKIGGEIINCDSVQVYQGIEIATAKVPFAEQRSVPHHLLDFVPPSVKYTAADWARAAVQTINEIERRGNVAILVGGTGFYLRALREPLFESPNTDGSLRQRLQEIHEKRGAEFLYKMLERLDPVSAAKLFPADYVRVGRALEYRFQTGKRFSEYQPLRAEPPELAARLKIFALNPPRQQLYERINRRAENHFDNGLVEETKRLLADGVPADSNALGAHGYRRVVEYLRGERSLESAVEQTKLDVRHYAKRQLTWFRREPDVVWLESFGDDPNVQNMLINLLLIQS